MTTGKTLLSEGQIKEIIREEFASQGVVLTEEQLEELFGMFGKSKIIKHIMKMDPDGSKLDKMGYDSRPEALKALGKKALKGLASELQAVTDAPEEKGFVQKVKDVYAGVKDIGILGGGAGTLLGGEETFDIEKRKALKDTAKKQLEGWLKKLDYKPARALYVSLQQQGFPNNDENDFMGNTAEIYNEYDKVVKDFEAKQVDCDRANTIIAVLRALVIYFQDFGMADKYFYVNEQEEPEQEEKMGAAQGSISKNFIAAYGNKLPLGLAAAGVACLAAGFAADSEFFQNFLKGFTDMEKIPGPGQIKAGVEGATGALLGNIESGEGIIKVVRRLGGPEMAQFGTAGGPGMGALAQNSKLLNLIGQAMISPKGPAALQQAIATNANPAQLFVAGSRSGTAKVGEELFGLNKGPFNEALSGLIDSEINPLKSVPADTVKNKFLTGLGTFLGPVLKFLGLSLLIAALASFTMRQKGKGKLGGSRMSKLKGIVDEMVDVPCDEEEKCPDGSDPPCEDDPPPPPPEDPCKDKPGTTWNPETEECECPDDLTWNPETKECEDIEPPPPQPPATKRLGLLRLDNDGVKVYIGTRRSKDQRGYERDVMQKAQDQAITGRNTDPTTDNLNSKKSKGGFRMSQRAEKDPEEAEWKDLMSAVKGSSKREPEPYVTVDASVYNDSAKALRNGGVEVRANSRGLKSAIKNTVEQLLKKFLEKKRKETVGRARQTIKSRFRREKIEINPRAIRGLITVLQDYGLVRSGELPDEPTKAPAGEEEIVDDVGRRPNPINESLTLARWKVLSGIK